MLITATLTKPLVQAALVGSLLDTWRKGLGWGQEGLPEERALHSEIRTFFHGALVCQSSAPGSAGLTWKVKVG